MANWYNNYTFPFNGSTFDTYVKENLASLGVSENKDFNIILKGFVQIGSKQYEKYQIISYNSAYNPNQNGLVWFFTDDFCLRSDFENYYIKKPLTNFLLWKNVLTKKSKIILNC